MSSCVRQTRSRSKAELLEKESSVKSQRVAKRRSSRVTKTPLRFTKAFSDLTNKSEQNSSVQIKKHNNKSVKAPAWKLMEKSKEKTSENDVYEFVSDNSDKKKKKKKHTRKRSSEGYKPKGRIKVESRPVSSRSTTSKMSSNRTTEKINFNSKPIKDAQHKEINIHKPLSTSTISNIQTVDDIPSGDVLMVKENSNVPSLSCNSLNEELNEGTKENQLDSIQKPSPSLSRLEKRNSSYIHVDGCSEPLSVYQSEIEPNLSQATSATGFFDGQAILDNCFGFDEPSRNTKKPSILESTPIKKLNKNEMKISISPVVLTPGGPLHDLGNRPARIEFSVPKDMIHIPRKKKEKQTTLLEFIKQPKVIEDIETENMEVLKSPPSSFTAPPRRSYSRKQLQGVKRHMFQDESESEEEAFEAVKKKSKSDKKKNKRDEEFDAWAKSMTSHFQDIENFNLALD